MTLSTLRMIPGTRKLHSDGAALQYKNRKNFMNLCHHKEDFSVIAKWHFSATSNGKGTCDGVGGTVKRLAGRASLQRRPAYDTTFEWACVNVPAVYFGYEDYEREWSGL